LKRNQMPVDWWTFLAISELNALHALVSLATWQGAIMPELTYTQIKKAKGVIRIAGEGAQLRLLKPAKDLYVALSPATSKGLYNEAKKKGFKFIACCDNLYPRPDDKETYRIALGRRSNTQTYPLWLLSDDEWLAAVTIADVKDKKAALAARNQVFKQCTAKLEKATLVIPERKLSLRKMCEIGAKRLGIDLMDETYAQRLTRELKLIDEKKFGDYFYIIADIIAWSKERMIVGPARGSSCGSLVCYLLDITAIDPIKYDLIFERFIDVNRNDLPDIDIDFSDAHRQLAFDYVEEKYGRERTARLGTVGMFRPKSALAAAGMSLAIPRWKVEKALDGLIVRSLGDSRALQTLGDTLMETGPGKDFLTEYPEAMKATPLEGHPTNASQHAAGIIITEKPIETYVAVDARTKAAMCDKKDAEDLGMLKIDMLGLTQLSIFDRTLELLGLMKRNDKTKLARLKDGRQLSDYFNSIPLDDRKAFDILNNHNYSGIFQFNGHALQSIAEQIETSHIEDIISMTALARPGPMASGGTTRWTRRRLGLEPVTYAHPVFKPYIDGTLGVVTFQEQVMQIGREVGDLSWDDVTQLRKAMSRSLGKEYFDQYGDRWKVGALKKGVPKDVAEKTWDELCSYGSWAFNRAHAVAYGLVSYWCCWLKAHYPSEFAAATLDAESDPNRQILLLRELYKEGIHYVPVDVNNSVDRWTIREDGVLLGPLTMIRGVGSAAAMEIIDCRKHNKPLRAALVKRLTNNKTAIDSIYPVTDAVKKMVGDERGDDVMLDQLDLTSLNIKSNISHAVDIKPDGRKRTVVAIGVITKLAPRDENEAINVARRGGKKFSGPTQALNFWIRDDTEEVFCKIGRLQFENLRGKEFTENSRVGVTLVAVKGQLPADFRMIRVEQLKIIGELDAELDMAPEIGGAHTRESFPDP
jgi:DNA-directed DNA polymerase III PolC